jgi:hypothetical protein
VKFKAFKLKIETINKNVNSIFFFIIFCTLKLK